MGTIALSKKNASKWKRSAGTVYKYGWCSKYGWYSSRN